MQRIQVNINAPDDFPMTDLIAGMREQLALADSELGKGDDSLKWDLIDRSNPTPRPMPSEERTVDEVCDSEVWHRNEVVEYMRTQCWEDDPAGGVRHANDHSKHFPTYFDAMKACIEVASEF